MKTDDTGLAELQAVCLALRRHGPGKQRSALYAAVIRLHDLEGHLSILDPGFACFSAGTLLSMPTLPLSVQERPLQDHLQGFSYGAFITSLTGSTTSVNDLFAFCLLH